MMTTKDSIELLTEKDVAASLNLSRAALRRWRRLGAGPPFLRLHRLIRYDCAKLREWIERQAGVAHGE